MNEVLEVKHWELNVTQSQVYKLKPKNFLYAVNNGCTFEFGTFEFGTFEFEQLGDINFINFNKEQILIWGLDAEIGDCLSDDKGFIVRVNNRTK